MTIADFYDLSLSGCNLDEFLDDFSFPVPQRHAKDVLMPRAKLFAHCPAPNVTEDNVQKGLVHWLRYILHLLLSCLKFGLLLQRMHLCIFSALI